MSYQNQTTAKECAKYVIDLGKLLSALGLATALSPSVLGATVPNHIQIYILGFVALIVGPVISLYGLRNFQRASLKLGEK